jgi:hypothetical protein
MVAKGREREGEETTREWDGRWKLGISGYDTMQQCDK